MSFWKYVYKGQKESLLEARFASFLLTKPSHFAFGYSDVMRQKRIAEWINQNSVNLADSQKWLSRIHHLHREGNFHFYRCTPLRPYF